MILQDAKVGMQVLFGRPNGQKTLGEIVKINPTKAKVRTLENRGQHEDGVTWTVPYSMMAPAMAQGAVPVSPVRPLLMYSPFQSAVEINVLLAISAIYTQLSPENLSCDGERPRQEQIRLRRDYMAKLTALFRALGRTVNETEVYEWEEQYHAARKASL